MLAAAIAVVLVRVAVLCSVSEVASYRLVQIHIRHHCNGVHANTTLNPKPDDTTPPECPGLDGHENICRWLEDLAKDLLLQAGVAKHILTSKIGRR